MMSTTILYPGGKLGYPTTGGQVYDFKLIEIIRQNIKDFQFVDDEYLNRRRGESVLKLPFRLIRAIRKLAKRETLIFNTALFPYYLLPFCILKIFYPRVKIIGIHHHFRFQEQSGFRRKVYKFLEFLNLRQCDAIINPCPYTKDVLLANWKKAPAISLENSFDISPKPLSSYDKYKFIYVGSVYERKGIIYLLKAISLIPKEKRERLTVDIIGQADEYSSYVKMLKDFIRNNKLERNVKFRGRLSDKELEAAYSSSYAFILPSLLEGYGLVIIEAMSYGLPVIAFNNSAMPYTIKDGENGLLAINKNPQSLADKIVDIMNHPDKHKALAYHAKATSRNAYSIADFEVDAVAFIEDFPFAKNKK